MPHSVPWPRLGLDRYVLRQAVCCSDPLADVEALKRDGKTAVLVGTPGRLMDMLQRCSFLDTKPLEVTTVRELPDAVVLGCKHGCPAPKAPVAASCEPSV